MGRLFYTPPRVSFLKELCHFLWHESQKNTHDPLFLGRYTLYLPNRRACLNAQKFLREVFQNYSNRTLVLPRMYGLNDYETLALDHGVMYDPSKIIDPFVKQHVIARLLLQIDKKLSLERALSLAKSMMPTLNTLIREDIKDDHLSLGPDDHPLSPFALLKTVMTHYPMILKEWNMEERDSLKKRIFKELPLFWKNNARGPVIIAGVSQYQSDSLELLKAAMNLSHVDVVVPCVEEKLLHNNTELLEQSPLFHSHKIIHKIIRALSENVMPHAMMHTCEDSKLPKPYLLKSHDFFDQARDIVACIKSYQRKGVEAITVVVPERRFAEHLSTTLALEGVVVNDSSAIPLSQTLFGEWIIGAGRVLTSRRMDDYLAFLKHPWVSSIARDEVYSYESRLRAQPLIHHTLDYFDGSLVQKIGPILFSGKVLKKNSLDQLEEILTFLSPHIFAQGGEVLSVFKEFHASFTLSVSLEERITGDDFMALLKGVLECQTITPFVPASSCSVNIIGLMEARVSTSDLLMITGLEEGLLPRLPPSDIWIAPYVQRRLFSILGHTILPSTEEWIGLQAQDLWQSMANAKQVIMCYRHFDNGQPTMPSRFLDDVDYLPYVLDMEENEDTHGERYASGECDMMDHEDIGLRLPFLQKHHGSAPCPKREQRPMTLSISAVELLLKDPYGFYAKYILKLYPLWHWREDARALMFGQYLHQALDLYTKQDDIPSPTPLSRANFVLSYFQQKKYPLSLMDRLRIIGFCHWLLDFEAQLDPSSLNVSKTEHGLSMSYTVDGALIEIKGILDRVDERFEDHQHSSVHIMDYKTGQVPSKKAIIMGYAPQLPLCGLLVMENRNEASFEETLHLSYLHALGKAPFGEVCSLQKIEELIDGARIGLQQCLVTYLRDDFHFHPSPNPWNKSAVNVYAHLARENIG